MNFQCHDSFWGCRYTIYKYMAMYCISPTCQFPELRRVSTPHRFSKPRQLQPISWRNPSRDETKRAQRLINCKAFERNLFFSEKTPSSKNTKITIWVEPGKPLNHSPKIIHHPEAFCSPRLEIRGSPWISKETRRQDTGLPKCL